MPGPTTQNVSVTINTSSSYAGSASFNVNNNVGTVVATVTSNPPSGTSFPNMSVSIAPTATDNSGNSYTCSVNNNSITSSTSSVVCIITIHASPGQTLPSPMSVGVTLTFGAGGGVPEN